MFNTKNMKELTSEQKVIRTIKRWGIGAVVGLAGLILAFNSYTIVSDGTVKTQTFLGKVDPNPVLPGFHPVNPFASFDTFSTKDIAVKIR
ncbi:lipoprotein [Escherichia phage vB_Eco_mar004NP2]